MVRLWDRKRVGDAATTTRDAERRGAPPSRHTFSPVTGWGVEVKRESAPEEAMEEMEEDEWAPGQVVRKRLGDWMGLGLSCFPCSGAFCFLFLLARRRPYYDRSGRSGSRKMGI